MRIHLDISNYGQLICSVVVERPNPYVGGWIAVDFNNESAISLQKTELWRESDENLPNDPSLMFEGQYCFQIDSAELTADTYFAKTEMQMDRPDEDDLEEGGDGIF